MKIIRKLLMDDLGFFHKKLLSKEEKELARFAFLRKSTLSVHRVY